MLSENHKINVIGPTELKLWPSTVNPVAPHTHTLGSCSCVQITQTCYYISPYRKRVKTTQDVS